MRILHAVVPFLITFGPIFMVQGLPSGSPRHYLIPLAGAVALGVGLAVLLLRLRDQHQRIVELEGQVRELRAKVA